MRINRTDKNNIAFTSWMNNKVVLKGLEKISDHGTSFAATTSLVMALGVRPLAIFATPNVERENKEYASVRIVVIIRQIIRSFAESFVFIISVESFFKCFFHLNIPRICIGR